jgi:hypothetical protein
MMQYCAPWKSSTKLPKICSKRDCYNIPVTKPNSPHRKIAPVVKKLRLGEAKNDAAYWRTRPYQERIEALEQIREEYHHWKADAQSGFQRVYTIGKR